MDIKKCISKYYDIMKAEIKDCGLTQRANTATTASITPTWLRMPLAAPVIGGGTGILVGDEPEPPVPTGYVGTPSGPLVLYGGGGLITLDGYEMPPGEETG